MPPPVTRTDDATPPKSARFAGLAALQHRNYRLFFSGQLISVTGTWMQTIAQAWLVLTLTDSAFKLGLVKVLQFGPILVLGLVSGVVADRFPRRNVLVVTQSTAAILAGVLTILTWTDHIQLWQIYALAFGLGISNSFDMPARQAFVGDLVGTADLPNAIALNSSLFNVGRLLGPALGGVLLAAYGPAICFALNTLSFVAVIGCLLMLDLPHEVRKVTTRGVQQIREGLGYVRNTAIVRLTIMMIAFVGIFGLNAELWIPLLAKNDLDSGARGFGILMAALGFGALLGALLLAFTIKGPSASRMLTTGLLLGGTEVLLAVLAWSEGSMIPAFLLVMLIGFAMTSTMSMANTIVQSTTPPELRGRVMSVYMTVFAGTAPFGAIMAGAIADLAGTPASIAVGGIVTVIAVASVAHLTGQRLFVRNTTSPAFGAD